MPRAHNADRVLSVDAREEVEEARASLEVAAPVWRRRLLLCAPVLLVAVAGAAWYFGDLRSLNSPDKIAAAARSVRDSPYAVLYVAAAFSIGTLVFFPITGLMAATAVSFDPLHGFLFAWLGALSAAIVTYWMGRLLGSEILRYVRGPKLERFQRELRTRALRASIAMRFVPVGSFSMLNMLAGSLQVPFGWYVLGNMLGLLPSALVLTLFADQLAAAVQHMDTPRLLVVGGALVALAGLWFVWRWRIRRRPMKPSLAE